MKKTLFLALTIISLLALPSVVLAQAKQSAQGGVQQQDMLQDPDLYEGDMVEGIDGAVQGNLVNNQVKTQNAGEETQLEVKTAENLQDGEGDSVTVMGKRESMSLVTEKMEILLGNEEKAGGMNQELKIILAEQQKTQEEVGFQLDKMEARQGFVKTIFGPDYKAIKTLRQQMEQNELRIKQLNELKTQLTNEAEETQVQELVQALVEENVSLEEQMMAEEETSSLLGWLMKFFAN